MSVESGFSLVEMLVVVAIVSVLSVGASLPLSRVDGSATQDGAALVAEVARLRRLAALSDRPHALVVSQSGWTEQRRSADGWSGIGEPGMFRTVRAAVDPDVPARLILLPDGRMTPADIRLSAGKTVLGCRTDGAAPLTCGPS
jgi:prepilin-type N-terminal cleavage/methylation domain-containing protein